MTNYLASLIWVLQTLLKLKCSKVLSYICLHQANHSLGTNKPLAEEDYKTLYNQI